MTPFDLYNLLLAKYPDKEVISICCVNTTCKKNGFCAQKQNYNVLDFDEIKNVYYCGQKGPMPASVDAVCLGGKNDHICFVELKGWAQYIARSSQQTKSVSQTISGYNLEGKLRDSQTLCRKIIGDEDLFAHIPTVFLLVTDIDVKERGLDAFADMMNVLSSTGSDIYSQCVSATRKTLDSVIHIDHDYIFCKDFDKYVATL